MFWALPVGAQDEPDSDEQKQIKAINQVRPSVVKIEIVTESGGSGIGSGVIFKEDGYVVTNLHVLNRSSRIIVILNDRRKLEAVVVGKSPRNDIAVLKVSATDLPVPRFGDSKKLQIGQVAIAIGNPYKFEGSVSRGIISALNRRIPTGGIIYKDLIQTDAAINPGNSGGALIDSDGRVIGINTLVFTGKGSHNAQGIGFAIPIHRALDVARRLMAGEVRFSPQPWIGINGVDVTREMAEMNMLPVNSGVLITQIQPVSPAERAGMMTGDIVVRADNKLVRSVNEFKEVLKTKKPGQDISLMLWREDRKVEITLKVSQKSVAP